MTRKRRGLEFSLSLNDLHLQSSLTNQYGIYVINTCREDHHHSNIFSQTKQIEFIFEKYLSFLLNVQRIFEYKRKIQCSQVLLEQFPSRRFYLHDSNHFNIRTYSLHHLIVVLSINLEKIQKKRIVTRKISNVHFSDVNPPIKIVLQECQSN